VKELQQGKTGVVKEVSDLKSLWPYEAEKLTLECYVRYGWRALRVRRAPRSRALKPVTKQKRWVAYFIFAPDGALQPYHDYTLLKLSEQDAKILIVMACRSRKDIPPDLQKRCDALYWKGLGGYDFSAYTIALNAIAGKSPRADVLVMNDSIYGPFCDLTPFFTQAPWDLTGFTASNCAKIRHIQSYAFILKNVTPERMRDLKWAFPSKCAFNSAEGAVTCQELWLARVASRSMSVGSFWFGEEAVVQDPSLTRGVALLRAGFPFLKRSLHGKHDYLHLASAAIEQLKRLGHPL